ncbi:B3 domain-containing transcription factor VRN1 isoform X1 [Jatropha curcas]|uniref:B3 domain-containing transcription factor VRN1 isoform X1 n=1 Tax=Jatropha curcas TaxID=180498 RepID=UPI0009D717FB|nr:B3 domain-containing transcription factor VRN1 isoform X1 [Jatropha curcas]
MILKSILSKLFVKRLGIELSDIARIGRLSLRNGKLWEVEVTKDNKNIWFDKGWSDFVEDNSICHRYLLSFEYKGNSNFRVIVFDPSTFEINYPNSNFENENGKAESRTDKMMGKKEDRLVLSNENEKDENKNVEVEVYCSEKYRKFFAKASDEIKKAILDADMYKPTNPAFKVLLRPYSINRSFLLVPNSFSAKYMTRVYEEAKVACPDGRKFLVRIRGWGTVTGLAFGTGWARICQHIDLKEGDVVILELINSSMDFLFKIKVFRS